jgi:cytochrome P450
MRMPDLNTEATAALVAGGAFAIGLTLVLRASSKENETQGPDKRPLRPIHVLENNSVIIGDLMERVENGQRLYDWFLEKTLLYNGEPWVIKIPGQADMIMVTTPEAVEEITIRQFALFDKGDFQNERILDMFGSGLVASDGAHWLHQRQAASKFFSASALRTMMTESIHCNVNKVCAVIDKSIADSGTLVDLTQLFHEFTLETFAEIGMGIDLNCIGAATRHPFQKALDVIAPITARRFRLPGFVWKTERWLNVGQEAELAEHKQVLHDWLHGVLEKSLENARAAKTTHAVKVVKNVVELFVDHSDGDAEGLRPDDLMGFILTFVIAARDTTANTLCWLLYALSKNPRVEKQLHTEMAAAFGSDHEPTTLTMDHIKSLTYLEATIKETVRLYPGGPFTVRQANQTTVLCGETLIRKGQIVGTCAWSMARNPLVWGPDAAEFKPERWIDPTTGALLHVPLTKYYSFSAGPRTCIGKNLAMLEMRIVVANLLYRYEFKIDPINDGSYEVAPTLNMKQPLLAKATRVRGGYE